MTTRATLSPRKTPQQARGKATVDAILSAATQVLVELGYDDATTNRIAEKAGISVGSLYQYFPNKDAVIAALIEQHEGEMFQQLARMASELESLPMEETIRSYVRAMLAVHALQPKLHQVLSERLGDIGLDRIRTLNVRTEALVRAYLERHRAEVRPKNLDLATFMLVTSVEAITHIAVLDRPGLLRDPAFGDEVAELVIRYLKVARGKG
jgi:AcrR family transcriptional regulator